MIEIFGRQARALRLFQAIAVVCMLTQCFGQIFAAPSSKIDIFAQESDMRVVKQLPLMVAVSVALSSVLPFVAAIQDSVGDDGMAYFRFLVQKNLKRPDLASSLYLSRKDKALAFFKQNSEPQEKAQAFLSQGVLASPHTYAVVEAYSLLRSMAASLNLATETMLSFNALWTKSKIEHKLHSLNAFHSGESALMLQVVKRLLVISAHLDKAFLQLLLLFEGVEVSKDVLAMATKIEELADELYLPPISLSSQDQKEWETVKTFHKKEIRRYDKEHKHLFSATASGEEGELDKELLQAQARYKARMLLETTRVKLYVDTFPYLKEIKAILLDFEEERSSSE